MNITGLYCTRVTVEFTTMISVQLIPFQSKSPETIPPQAGPGAEEIAVFATINRSHNEITADFTLTGDTSAILWPPVLPQTQSGTDLWKHTCFELFVADTDSHAYWEYNASPSRQWAIYGFADYRRPAGIAAAVLPSIGVPDLTDTVFTLSLTFPLEAPLRNKTISLGVCAVIEKRDNSRLYYALTHCAKKPDFHRRESFLITLPD